MRIAIVNDISMVVEALRRIVSTHPGYEVAWVAYDGAEAVSKCARDVPDLILMDLVMPVLDGVKATESIMKNNPCPILIVTATVSGHSSLVFEAMGYGALDVVKTPTLDLSRSDLGGSELLKKIERIALLTGKVPYTKSSKEKPVEGVIVRRGILPPLMLIGASTGGPKALHTLIQSFPKTRSFATVIIQHVDEQFAQGLSKWLTELTSIPVTIAKNGSKIISGDIYLAGKNDHLLMHRDLTLGYSKYPLDNPYRPSVDVFFTSVAQYWPEKGVAALLTGMGSDGAYGLKVLKDAGWHTLAQDSATSVVYGMPKAAAEMGAADEIVRIEDMGVALLKSLERQAKS